MSGTELAAIIAASGFVLLVLFLAIPLLKLGRLIDRSSDTLIKVTEEIVPLVGEMTITLEETNRQLKKVDGITTDVASVTTNLSSLVAVLTSSVGGSLAKIAGLGGLARKFFGKR